MKIVDAFEHLASEKWKETIHWPPDAFALCAFVLQKSGSYLNVVSHWPPPGTAPMPEGWELFIRKVGAEWREKVKAPAVVKKWWQCIVRAQNDEVGTLAGGQRRKGRMLVWEALACICAAADEASAGLGMPGSRSELDLEASLLCWRQLTSEGRITTFCRDVDPSKVCILPKLHTPRTGITLRSLSHNLAFVETSEVIPVWSAFSGNSKITHRLNLLLVPWPLAIAPTHFAEVENGRCGIGNMPPAFGFFNYEIRGGGSSWPKEQFERVLRGAMDTVGPIDGVILPELAVRVEEADDVYRQITANFPEAFLIAGVGASGNGTGPGTNKVLTARTLSPSNIVQTTYQEKHHRWLLTGSQIDQYGIATQLDRGKSWWENTQLGQRQLQFFSLTPDLTLCCLICEDLARQDPIANLIRSVGPNLVVALLMDGPQLCNRWPARYATVLADDPGSSVLTLTSLGMARLCRPLGVCESRVIGLWKDAIAGPFEIELPYDAQAVVISAECQDVEEWSADGRSDQKSASHWALKGVFPVRVQ